MNDFYSEFKLRRPDTGIGIAVMVVIAALGTYIAIGALIQHEWLVLWCFGLFAVVFWVLSVRFGINYYCDDVWRMGIRDETLWWDSPRWPRSKGSVPIVDIREVVIRESQWLTITTAHGMIHHIEYIGDPGGLRDFLGEHYPDTALKFIMDGS